MKSRRMIAAALLWALSIAPAQAHGLLVHVRSDGAGVAGSVRYSNGQPGAGTWVQMFDLTEPGAAPQSMAVGADGSFRLPGTVGHRYRIVVAGDEGHAVESRIVLGVQAHGETVDSGRSHDQ